MIENLKFIHFLTTAFIIEVFILILFKFTNQSSKSILGWYDNLGWTSIILDILSLMIGFYLSKFIYQYLTKNNYLTKKNEFIKFLVIVLLVQIVHDFC